MGDRGRRVLASIVLASLLAAGASTAAPAWAADCGKAVTQADLDLCADRDRAEADAALNATYAKLLASPAVADRLGKLRAAERAWVDYRNAQCGFEGASAEGGSMQPMVIAGCLRALTIRRTSDLKAVLACDGASC